jgi:hypothetical protein
VIGEGPTEGEPSFVPCDDLRIRFARLVRGSSRRIMTVRFRSADIRVINRRICSLDYHPCCPIKHTGLLASNAASKNKPQFSTVVVDRSLHIRTEKRRCDQLYPWCEVSRYFSHPRLISHCKSLPRAPRLFQFIDQGHGIVFNGKSSSSRSHPSAARRSPAGIVPSPMENA